MARRALSVAEHVDGVLSGDRARLARTITLVESERPEDEEKAQRVLAALLPHTGRAHRVGITGIPGAGKSTFIEAFGGWLTAAGKRVAVLAVDPSSELTGGSILGDKTRMPRLSNDARAFVRPVPSGRSRGGVASRTRESLLVCEAAGHDVVLVETVGVGQAETTVADITDFYLLLTITGAGDGLQGIKRGILELVDLVAVNKADGDNISRAEHARLEYERGLQLLRPKSASWSPIVVTCSALEGHGIAPIWAAIEEHRRRLDASGQLAADRRRRSVEWLWSAISERLMTAFRRDPAVQADLDRVIDAVAAGELPVGRAAADLLATFARGRRDGATPR